MKTEIDQDWERLIRSDEMTFFRMTSGTLRNYRKKKPIRPKVIVLKVEKLLMHEFQIIQSWPDRKHPDKVRILFVDFDYRS